MLTMGRKDSVDFSDTQKFIQHVVSTGGGSRRFTDKQWDPSSGGYMVSLASHLGGDERKLSGPDPAGIEEHFRVNRDRAMRMGNKPTEMHQGLWRGGDSNAVFADVTRRLEDHHEAVHEGWKHGQEAVYDVRREAPLYITEHDSTATPEQRQAARETRSKTGKITNAYKFDDIPDVPRSADEPVVWKR